MEEGRRHHEVISLFECLDLLLSPSLSDAFADDAPLLFKFLEQHLYNAQITLVQTNPPDPS